MLKQFGIKAIPLDTARNVPLAKIDDKKMKLFSLSPFTYEEIITQIVIELKSPESLQIK